MQAQRKGVEKKNKYKCLLKRDLKYLLLRKRK